MQLYNTYLLHIHCLTNLHAGSGKTDAGHIDNLVQRDPATGLPCINDSSLKGALREYFEYCLGKTNPVVTYIFGGEGENTSKGYYQFLPAQLFSIPIRSSNRPFYSTTSILQLELLAKQLEFMEVTGGSEVIKDIKKFNSTVEHGSKATIYGAAESKHTVYLEDFEVIASLAKQQSSVPAVLQSILGNEFAIADEATISLLTDDNHLPVIARNKLNNGVSENLWYEQVIPRESKFTSIVMIPKTDTNFFKDFTDYIHKKVIQVGANASVGYGQCYFEIYSLNTKK